jgi:hypothetical protein
MQAADRYRSVIGARPFANLAPGCADLVAAGPNKPLKSSRISAVSQAQRLELGGHRPGHPLISKTPSSGQVQAAMLAAHSRPGPPLPGKIANQVELVEIGS